LTRNFRVDLALPESTIDGTWGTTAYRTSTGFVISGEASDANGVSSVGFSSGSATLTGQTLDGAANSSPRSWQVTVTAAQQGLNSVTALVTDAAGRQRSYPVQFFFDSNPPVINILNLSDNAVLNTA